MSRVSASGLLQAEVRPRCGRVVGFGAGRENPHGVRAVTGGQRCAVALWFTLDPAHEEKVRTIAEDERCAVVVFTSSIVCCLKSLLLAHHIIRYDYKILK